MECEILILVGFLVVFLTVVFATLISGVCAAKLKSCGLGFVCFVFLLLTIGMVYQTLIATENTISSVRQLQFSVEMERPETTKPEPNLPQTNELDPNELQP